MERPVSFEPAANELADSSSMPPLVFQLPPAEGREILNAAQDLPVYKYPAAVSTITVDTGIGIFIYPLAF